jgi:cytochrome c-type biogenesis protein CcmH/NrfF
MIKILHVLFWYVAAHLVLFGVLFLVARALRNSKQQRHRLSIQ